MSFFTYQTLSSEMADGQRRTQMASGKQPKQFTNPLMSIVLAPPICYNIDGLNDDSKMLWLSIYIRCECPHKDVPSLVSFSVIDK